VYLDLRAIPYDILREMYESLLFGFPLGALLILLPLPSSIHPKLPETPDG
jgi:hypothetical protein